MASFQLDLVDVQNWNLAVVQLQTTAATVRRKGGADCMAEMGVSVHSVSVRTRFVRVENFASAVEDPRTRVATVLD